eukprot:TRINITY_DN34017_c0_g1_i1.p1 TRINITY_DN34017_c0_g1~~TRINITY_DN34017_c0_g1_i1.p1  ORF type:complete len:481 (+),score=114.88 TRINITY_DN34017_c0_g1_i1:1-1443(+)
MELTKGGVWNDSATNQVLHLTVAGEDYITMSVPVKRSGTTIWYFNLIVPRESISGDVEAVLRNTSKLMRATLATARDDRSTAFESSLFAVSSIVLVSVGITAIIVHIMVGPLRMLESEMTAVSHMQLESSSRKTDSRLTEIHRMQLAFGVMVQNLIAYREYMPQSVLVRDDDGIRDDEFTGILTEDSIAKQTSSSLEVVSRHCDSTVMEPVCPTGDMELRKRMVTFVAFNIRDFHKTLDAKGLVDIQRYHGEVIQHLIACVAERKGMSEVFSGDRLVASFNASLSVPTHRVTACTTVRGYIRTLAISQATQSAQVTCGVACGETYVGNMGCSGMKRFSLISRVFQWCQGIERIAKEVLETGCLLDESIHESAGVHYECPVVCFAEYPRLRHSKQLLYHLGEETQAVITQEWMYQVEQVSKTSLYANWNSVASSLMKEQWGTAALLLKVVPDATLNEMKQFIDAEVCIENECVEFHVLKYF